MLKFTFEPQSFTKYSKKYQSWSKYQTTIPLDAEIKTNENGQYFTLTNVGQAEPLLYLEAPPDGISALTFSRTIKYFLCLLEEHKDDPGLSSSWLSVKDDLNKGESLLPLFSRNVDGPKLLHRVEFIGNKFYQYDTENMELLHYDKIGNEEDGEAAENTSLLRAFWSEGQDIFFEQCDYTHLTSYVRLRERSAAIELWSAYKNTNNQSDIERVFGPVKYHDYGTTESELCE